MAHHKKILQKLQNYGVYSKALNFLHKMLALMALLKISEYHRDKDDNYIAACGYLSLSCELEEEDSTGTTSTIKWTISVDKEAFV